MYVCKHKCHSGVRLSVCSESLHSPLSAAQECAPTRRGVGAQPFSQPHEGDVRHGQTDERQYHFTKYVSVLSVLAQRKLQLLKKWSRKIKR